MKKFWRGSLASHRPPSGGHRPRSDRPLRFLWAFRGSLSVSPFVRLCAVQTRQNHRVGTHQFSRVDVLPVAVNAVGCQRVFLFRQAGHCTVKTVSCACWVSSPKPLEFPPVSYAQRAKKARLHGLENVYSQFLPVIFAEIFRSM